MFKIKIPRLPYREDRLFGILMLLVFVVPLAFNYYSYEKFETVKIALWLILAGWALFTVARQKKELNLHAKGAFFCLGLFVILAFIAAVSSNSIINGLFGSYPRFTNGFLFYALWAITAVLLLLTADRARLEILLKILFFDAGIIAVMGMLQSMGIGFYNGLSQAALERAPSLLGNPNFSSMFLVCMAPFAFPLLLQSKKILSRCYYLVGAFLMVWAVIVLSSRGAWLGLAVAGAVSIIGLFIFRFPRKYILYFGAALAIGCFIWFGFLKVTRPNVILSTFKLSELNVDLRLYVWDIAAKAIKEKPFFGVGPGNFQVFFEQNRGSNLADQSGVFDDAHNFFLQIAATAGLPVAACFLALMAYSVYEGIKKLRQNLDPWVLALLISIITWSIMASFNPVSSANFLLLAVVLAALFLKQENVHLQQANKIFRFLTPIMGAGLMLLGICFIASEILFYKAYLDYFNNKFSGSRKYLNIARIINPTSQMFYGYQIANDILLNEPPAKLQKEIEKMVRLQPYDSKSYLIAAKLDFLLYQQTKDSNFLHKAVGFMDQCLGMDRLFAQRYFRAGFYQAETGDLDAAIKQVKFGLSMDFKNIPGWILLARIYQLQGKQEQGMFALKKAYELGPDIQDVRFLYRYAKDNPENFTKLPIPAVIDTRNFD